MDRLDVRTKAERRVKDAANGAAVATPFPGKAGQTESEKEQRRAKVLVLHLRHLSQWDIATALGVDQATISRDLAHIRKEWRGNQGLPADFNISEAIGETLARFDDAEANAWRDYHKCSVLTQPHARRGFFREALLVQQMRIHFLQDLSLFDRAAVPARGVASEVMGADDIRGILRAEGLLDLKRLPDIIDVRGEAVEEDDEAVLRNWLGEAP